MNVGYYCLCAKCILGHWSSSTQMELCLNPGLVKKWKRMLKKEPVKGGNQLDPSTTVEVKFLRNLIEEFLEVVIC
jgi:hypothetical protein